MPGCVTENFRRLSNAETGCLRFGVAVPWRAAAGAASAVFGVGRPSPCGTMLKLKYVVCSAEH